MKQFCLFLQTIVLSALALGISLQANISPLAFNGIFKCFKPGYEMYAPNLGCAALQTGLINALRFYTTIPGGHDAHGRRMWINDKAPADDPVAALALLLFPSPAGNLTAMTNHPENIGRNLTVNHVAQLLNLCAHIRATVGNMGGNRFGNDARKCLKRLSAAAYKESENKNINDNYFSRFFEFQYDPKDPKYKLRSLLFSDQGRTLIVALCKIIEHEERITEKRFYAKYQAEQLLNAFFCLKFGKDDISELLENLDNFLVDHEQLIEARLIDRSDIERVKQKNLDAITLDDLWVIQNRDLIDQVIPYPRGCKPVNNGLASGYDRAQDKLMLTQEFPDCTETTLRHVWNLVLYASKEGQFNIKPVLNMLQNSLIPHLRQNLEAFYALQSRDKANSGERLIRDAWCKVVGDLGEPVRYRKKSVPTNAYNDTEVDSGIVNIIRVLNIIFNLGLDPEPVYENDQQFAKKVTEWAQNGLQKLFETISPEKKVNIEITGVNAFRAFGNYEHDCGGKINVTVNQDFKFTMSVGSRHAQFDTIDILVPEQAPINEDILNQVINKFENILLGTTTESIFLLNNKTKNRVTTPAYRFFKNGVHDSAQIIQALEILLVMTQQNEISLTRSAQILKNLLRNFLWQDQEMYEKIQAILKEWTFFALQKKNQSIINALQDEVKSVQYDLLCEYFNNNADDFLDFFSKAHTIFCSQNSYISSFALLRNHQSIKTIRLPKSNITELEISGICPSLETLNLHDTKQLTSLKLSSTLQNLKSINLSKSAIEELEVSGDTCPSLETLDLHDTSQLKKFKLSGILQNLKSINLCQSGITDLEISGDTCPNLEYLNLSSTKSLKLSGTFLNLKSIDLSFAAITELEISGDMCPNLETLNLSFTKQLTSLKLSETLQKLQSIELISSEITELEISGICPNLENLDLSYTWQLTSLKLSGPLQKLQSIKLISSGITELEISGICPNLESLNLAHTKNLRSLKLSGTLQKLQSINLYASVIKEVEVARGCCPNLQIDDPRIKIIDLKRKSLDEEIDDQELPDAKRKCLNDIREN